MLLRDLGCRRPPPARPAPRKARFWPPSAGMRRCALPVTPRTSRAPSPWQLLQLFQALGRQPCRSPPARAPRDGLAQPQIKTADVGGVGGPVFGSEGAPRVQPVQERAQRFPQLLLERGLEAELGPEIAPVLCWEHLLAVERQLRLAHAHPGRGAPRPSEKESKMGRIRPRQRRYCTAPDARNWQRLATEARTQAQKQPRPRALEQMRQTANQEIAHFTEPCFSSQVNKMVEPWGS